MKTKILILLLSAAAILAAQTGQTVGNMTVWGGNVQPSDGSAITGGYLRFAPVEYNPYRGPICLDKWGNKVQQPLPTPGAIPFGANELIMWNSLSPSMPFNAGTGSGLVQPVVVTLNADTGPGPCGVPLAVNTNYGINTNGYFFGRAGLATDLPFYNSIQSLQGGIVANSITMGVLYPTGTVTTTGVLSAPAYLGGHVDMGHSVGPPSNGTIATVNNPFSGGEGLVQGQTYFDDALNCYNGYYGTAGAKKGWNCIDQAGAGGTGLPAGPVSSIQFNGGGTPAVLSGSASLTFCTACGGDGASNILALLGGSVNSGMQAPVFSSSAANSGSAIAFTDQFGNFKILGDGTIQAQNIAVSTVFNSFADVNGGDAFTTSNQTVHITGAGDFLGQNASVTHVFNSLADVSVSGTVSTSGTAVTKIGATGSFFFAGMVGGNITINGVLYQVSAVADTTHLTLNVSAGTQGSAAWSFGNAVQSSLGSFQITGSGIYLGQQFVAHGVFNSQADVFGGNAFQTSTGNMRIDGGGNGFFQTLTAGTMGGSDATQVITVNPGYIYSHGGFATDSASTAAINANNGTIQGLYLTAINSVHFVATGTPPPAVGGQAEIYMVTGSNTLMACVDGCSGGAVNLLTGGGGGGTASGSLGFIQYSNGSGGFLSSANLKYTPAGAILQAGLLYSSKGAGNNTDAFSTLSQEAHITGNGDVFGQSGTFNAVSSISASAGYSAFDRNGSGASAVFYRNGGVNGLWDSVAGADFIEYGNIGGFNQVHMAYRVHSGVTGANIAYDTNGGEAVIYGNGAITGQTVNTTGYVTSNFGFSTLDRSATGSGVLYRDALVNRLWDQTYGDMIQFGDFSGAPAINLISVTVGQQKFQSQVTGHNYAFEVGGGSAALWGDGVVSGQTGTFNEVQGVTINHFGQLRASLGGYGTIFRQDGADFYLLMTSNGDPFGSWNTLRPFRINDASGAVFMANGVVVGGGLSADYYQAGLNCGYCFTVDLNGNAATGNSITAGAIIGGNFSGSGMTLSATMSALGGTFGIAGITSSGAVFFNGGANVVGGGGPGLNVAAPGSPVSANFSDGNGSCRISFVAGGITCPSDARLKTDVAALPDELAKMMQLRPVSYTWKPSGAHMDGLIAQEVQKLFPGVVHETDQDCGPGSKCLDLSYTQLIPYMIRAAQEQQAEITALRSEVDALKKK